MNEADEKKKSLKEEIIHETVELLLTFLYLAVFFCSFTAYRRLVMLEFGISYFEYGFALVKALVLAKVILLGQHVRFVRIFDDRPLIFPTLYKVIWFSLFAVAFEILEHVIGGFLHGKDLAGVCEEFISTGRYELLARSMVVLFAFVPFFAFNETRRVLGEGILSELFFKRRAATAKPTHPKD
jgi:hypothetical protein